MVHEACCLLEKEVYKLEAEDVIKDTIKLLRSAKEALEEGSTECYEQQALRCLVSDCVLF